MLSPQLLRQIRHLQLRTRKMVSDVLQGSYHSAFKGQGMEFDQVRDYQLGDDIRRIDWNVTARMNSPFLKEFIEEREVTVMLVVDVSASGTFGSVEKLKKEVAAEFAAVIAFSALKNKDQIGLILVSDQVELYIPPAKGNQHIWRLVKEILTFAPKHLGTDLNAGLNYLNKVIKRKTIVFVVSDFQMKHYEKNLRLTARRHDVIAVPVIDPREQELPAVGIVDLKDPESREMIRVDTFHQKTRIAFQQYRQQFLQKLEETLRKDGIDLLWLYTNQPYLFQLIQLFQKRGHRR